MTTLKTVFRPQVHGWKFGNSFSGNLTEKLYMCGGMCFAALDRFFAGIPIEDDDDPPEPETELHDEIWERQVDTMQRFLWAKWLRWRYFDYSERDDEVSERTNEEIRSATIDEWNNIKGSLDRGVPVTLMLIKSYGMRGYIGDEYSNWHMDHQVVAYHYEEVGQIEEDKVIKILYYDPNTKGLIQDIFLDLSEDKYGIYSTKERLVPWFRGVFPIDHDDRDLVSSFEDHQLNGDFTANVVQHQDTYHYLELSWNGFYFIPWYILKINDEVVEDAISCEAKSGSKDVRLNLNLLKHQEITLEFVNTELKFEPGVQGDFEANLNKKDQSLFLSISWNNYNLTPWYTLKINGEIVEERVSCETVSGTKDLPLEIDFSITNLIDIQFVQHQERKTVSPVHVAGHPYLHQFNNACEGKISDANLEDIVVVIATPSHDLIDELEGREVFVEESAGFIINWPEGLDDTPDFGFPVNVLIRWETVNDQEFQQFLIDHDCRLRHSKTTFPQVGYVKSKIFCKFKVFGQFPPYEIRGIKNDSHHQTFIIDELEELQIINGFTQWDYYRDASVDIKYKAWNGLQWSNEEWFRIYAKSLLMVEYDVYGPKSLPDPRDDPRTYGLVTQYILDGSPWESRVRPEYQSFVRENRAVVQSKLQEEIKVIVMNILPAISMQSKKPDRFLHSDEIAKTAARDLSPYIWQVLEEGNLLNNLVRKLSHQP